MHSFTRRRGASGRFLGVAAALFVASLAACPNAASAATLGSYSVRPSQGHPSYITQHLSAGQDGHGSLVVTNTGPTRLRLIVYPVDGLTAASSGAVYSNRGARLDGTGTWVRPAVSNITLGAHGTAKLPFTVAVPPSASAGDHLGGIAVQQASGRPSAHRPFGVRTLFRTVIGVLVHVHGAAAFAPRFTSARIAPVAHTRVASIRIGIRDQGLLLGKPLLRVRLSGPHGYSHTVMQRLGTVLPSDAIDYTLPWPTALQPGRYVVTATAPGTRKAVLHRAVELRHPLTSSASLRPKAPNGGQPNHGWIYFGIAIAAGIVLVTLIALISRRGRRRGARRWNSVRQLFRTRNALGLGSLAAVLVIALALGVSASRAGTLTTSTVSISRPIAGATGVTYTYSFIPATGSNLSSITMTVPAGTSGTPTIASVSSTGNWLPTNGTLTLSGTTLTYSFSAYANAGYSATLAVGGLTNTPTAGTYTSTVKTIGPSYSGYPVVDTGTTGGFSISGGTLTNLVWGLSNSHEGAAGVTYSYGFKTATASTLTSASMSVPAGTSGSPALGSVSGLPSGGSVSLSGTTLTYSGFSGTIAAGTTVSLQVTGLTNTATTGAYTSTLTTLDGSTPVDSAASSAVVITSGQLSNALWSDSTVAAGAAGATYTYAFTTATGANLSAITMTVPSGTSGAPTVQSVTSTYGSLPTNGTVALSGSTLTYSFASTYINSGYAISLTIGGLTNTPTSGTYSSDITTLTSGTGVDSAVTAGISISGGTLTSVSWSAAPATSNTASTYTFHLVTASSAKLTSVTMAVPPGTTGTPTLSTVAALPSSGTLSLASNTLTYAFSATSVSAGTAVTIIITGLTNTTTAGNYTSTISTLNGSSPVGSGVSASVAITGGSLGTPLWSVSPANAGATGATYTFSFTTATGADLLSIALTMPAGTRGTPTVISVATTVGGQAGSPAVPTNGTVALTGGVLTYSFTSTYINAGESVHIQVGGLTNTPTVGSYTSQITTENGPIPVDTGNTTPIAISGGVLTNTGWEVSSDSGGASDVTYTYGFTTASTSTLSSVTMTVPPGTSGTPAVGTVTGLPSNGTVTFSQSGLTLTYSFSATTIAAGTAITVQIAGMTNTTTTGSYSSQLATVDGSTVVDTSTSANISIVGSSLTNLSWSISQGVEGTANVEYTYTFTTATGATLTGFTMTVPPGTSGTPVVASVTSAYNGEPASVPTNGTISLADNTLTYSFNQYVNSNTSVTIVIRGMTNTTTPGSYTSQITTRETGGPVDSGVSAAINISGGTIENPVWTDSSVDTGAANATYGYQFDTASSSNLTSVSITVPPGTAGTPQVADVTGLPWQADSSSYRVALASNQITYSFPSTAIASGTAVSLSFSGLTNTTTTGSYYAQLTSYDGGTPIDTGETAPIAMSGGTLTTPTWTPSSFDEGSSAGYVYTFTTGSGATLDSISMTVPPGTAGAPAAGAISSTGSTVPTGGTVTLDENTLTYTFPTATYVNAGYNVSIQITGLVNTAVTGSYISQIVTHSATAPVDEGYTSAVSITAGSPYQAYVVSATAAELTPLTLGSTTAGTTISVGTAPQAVAITPDGTKAYVVDPTAGTLTPITLASNTAGATITLSGCTTPTQVAITPDGTRAYVTCAGNGKVVPVTLAGGTVGSPISVGSDPVGIAVAPGGSTVYVVNSSSGTLTPITTATGATGSAISLSGCGSPRSIALTPSSATGYVTCESNNVVVPVALASGSVGKAITVGTSPTAIAITPSGSTAYVADSGAGTITPIQTATNSAGSAITVGTTPSGIAIAPDGSAAYVSNESNGTVDQIELSSATVLDTITVGASPVGVAFVPDQAPNASLSVTAAGAGSPTSFDASASTQKYGTITSYTWLFGDGSTETTTTPTVQHTYASGCSYAASVTETDSAGTSTTQVFTGQTVSDNGGSAATASATVQVSRIFGFISVPSSISFAATLNGSQQTEAATLPIDIGIGLDTTGWNVSATSTTFSTTGGSSHALPAEAVSINLPPTTTCDYGAHCTTPSDAVAYPATLPAASAAPTATELFDATAGTGLCDQTATPTFTLTIPADAYAGSYSSTWTLTLSSAP